VDPEGLERKALYINGSRIKQFGFEYSHPKLTKELILEVIHDWTEKQQLPAGLLRT